MNHFVIQGIGKETLYWNGREWSKEPIKYKTQLRAKEVLEELKSNLLHFDFTTGKKRKLSVKRV